MAAGCSRRVQPDRIVHIEHEPAPVRRRRSSDRVGSRSTWRWNQRYVELSVQRREAPPQLSAGLQGRLHALDLGAAVQHRVLSLVEQREVAQLDSVARQLGAGIFVRTRNDGACGPRAPNTPTLTVVIGARDRPVEPVVALPTSASSASRSARPRGSDHASRDRRRAPWPPGLLRCTTPP